MILILLILRNIIAFWYQNQTLYQQKFCKNSNYIDEDLPKNAKIVLNKSTRKKVGVPTNLLKHLFSSKYFY